MRVNMRKKFGINARQYGKCLAETVWTYFAGVLAARPLPWDCERMKGSQLTSHGFFIFNQGIPVIARVPFAIRVSDYPMCLQVSGGLRS